MGIALPWRWFTFGGSISPKAAACLAWAATPLIILLAFAFVPTSMLQWPATLGSHCLFVELFHLPCPGCGVTRSVLAFVHGDVAHAWLANPAGPVIVVALVTQSALSAFVQFRIVAFELLLKEALWGDAVVAGCLLAVWSVRVLLQIRLFS